MKRRNLMKQIENACRSNEIDYNDLIDLGIKLQTEYVKEITRAVKRQTRQVDELINGRKQSDDVRVNPFTQMNMFNPN